MCFRCWVDLSTVWVLLFFSEYFQGTNSNRETVADTFFLFRLKIHRTAIVSNKYGKYGFPVALKTWKRQLDDNEVAGKWKHIQIAVLNDTSWPGDPMDFEIFAEEEFQPFSTRKQ